MESVFIIAEAGVNHNGNIDIAIRMIDVAAQSGANAIKFQTFKTEKLVSKKAHKAYYQKVTTNQTESQYDMLKKLELSIDDHLRLIDHAHNCHIKFLSTPFDSDSIDLLIKLGLDTFKIPSGEITNLPYLRKIGSLRKNLILSTGMATLDEINKALNILISEGTPKDKIAVLHATTEYPAPFDEVNLKAINTIERTFGVKVGYSDHTAGIEIPIAAVAIGAKVIEKHFTLDRNMEGPDHKASLEPEELEKMVIAIRHIEKALGNGIKIPSPSEKKNINIVRKSIHYARNLQKGKIILEEDIIMKRPGNGISPMELDTVLTRALRKNVKADSMVKWDDLL